MIQPRHIPEKPIAIHFSEHTFSSRWVHLCESWGIPYRLVDCYSSDIIDDLEGCSGLMWNWLHSDASASKFARQLTLSLEARGTPVFPDSRTCWHYDDKLGQKYLFEALKIPHAKTYAFYSKQSALDFVRAHGLPVVFKLTRGAGSMNVRLLTTMRQARKSISRSFGRGWPDQYRAHVVRERVWRARRDRTVASIVGVSKGLARAIVPHKVHRTPRLEAGYAYLQEFIEGNDSDVRVVVIGKIAYGFRRLTRNGDFRASGSGKILHGRDHVPIDCIKVAFESAARIGSQVTAFDFVFSHGEPLVVEISYSFLSSVSEGAQSLRCPGYWDEGLRWHDAPVDPEKCMLELFLNDVALREQNKSSA